VRAALPANGSAHTAFTRRLAAVIEVLVMLVHFALVRAGLCYGRVRRTNSREVVLCIGLDQSEQSSTGGHDWGPSPNTSPCVRIGTRLKAQG
jgi:hypothetical protein